MLMPLSLSLSPFRFTGRLHRSLRIPVVARHGQTGSTRCSPRRLYVTVPPSKSSLTSPSGGRSSGSGGRKIIVGLVGATTLIVLVGAGGTVVYARYIDPQLRSRLEKDGGGTIISSFPTSMSEWLLDQVFGPKDVVNKVPGRNSLETDQLQLATKEKAVMSGLVQKKLAREAAVAKEVEAAAETRPASIKTPPSEEHMAPTLPTPIVPPIKSEVIVTSNESKPARRPVPTDASSTVENEAIEKHVKVMVGNLESVVSAAVSAHEEAIRSIRLNSDTKNNALSAAETKSVEARSALEKIKEIVQQGRKSKLTCNNRALIEAEEVANRAIYRLQKAEADMSLAASEANILQDYKKHADESRLKITPAIKGERLSEEELGRQIGLLRQQIDTQQNGEQHRVQKALDAQRHEYETLTTRRMDIELQKQQRDLEIIYQKKVADMDDKFEQELLQQLRRQAAAHSEHLHDVLQAQQKQLADDYGRRLDDHVQRAKHEFQVELAGSLGRLDGINNALKARSELNAATYRAQRLWVACQALRHSVLNGRSQVTTWEEQRKPLVSEVEAINRAAGTDDKFVKVVLSSIPAKAISEGVFTESALKDRFHRVNDACRKVSLIGDQGGSLFRYGLSYLQSLLLLNSGDNSVTKRADEEKQELDDLPSIDMDTLDTYVILERASRCVNRGNLELALRYMNQLKGAPRAVARDWLQETRLLLEVSQITDALVARAAVTELQ